MMPGGENRAVRGASSVARRITRLSQVMATLLTAACASVALSASAGGLAGMAPVLLWDGALQRAALADGRQVTVAQAITADGATPTSWRVQGTIAAPGAWHLSAGPDDGSVYASAAEEGVLKFIDLAQARQVHQVPAAGAAPGPLVYHPVLKRLASFNAGGAVTLFDTASRAYEGLLPLGETPSAVALAPDGRVLALLPGQHMLALLALRPFRMFGRFDLPQTCAQPQDVLVDGVAGQVFVDCGGSVLAVFDFRQGEWLAAWSWPALPASPRHLLWDPAQRRLLALQLDGQLIQASADPDRFPAQVVAHFSVGSAAAWDAGRHQLVLAQPDPARAGVYNFSFQQVP